MSYKDIRIRYLLLARIFVLLTVLGIGILIFTSIGDDPSHLAFSLIAFVISCAALVMTTLQSMSIARQVQITERAARLVHETGEQLKSLVLEDRKLEREIRQDIQLDHAIIGILEEHGIGDDEEERHRVAKQIAHKVAKHVDVVKEQAAPEFNQGEMQ